MFQHRHYEKLAEVFRLYIVVASPPTGSVVRSIVHDLEELFARDNPHFDPYRWRKACGVIDAARLP